MNTHEQQGKAPKQQWEYKSVYCHRVSIHKLPEGKSQGETDDHHKASQQEQMELSRQFDPKLWARIPGDYSPQFYNLVWSDTKKYYTWLEPYLNELGQQGWEVIVTTPPWTIGGSYLLSSQFNILLKRSLH